MLSKYNFSMHEYKNDFSVLHQFFLIYRLFIKGHLYKCPFSSIGYAHFCSASFTVNKLPPVPIRFQHDTRCLSAHPSHHKIPYLTIAVHSEHLLHMGMPASHNYNHNHTSPTQILPFSSLLQIVCLIFSYLSPFCCFMRITIR